MINNHTNISNYKSKYYKYKNKYLQLKNILGGGIKTAKVFFDKFILSNENILETLYQNDIYFKRLLDNKSITFPIQNSNEIFEIIVKDINKDFVENFIKIYLTQQMGSPNSLENKGRFLDASKKLKILRNNKIPNIPAVFKSLTELEDFIDENKEKLEKIEEKNRLKDSKKEKHKIIKKEGEDDVEIMLNNDNVIIYKPTTVAGSKYYGANTRWCTAADNGNMFDEYNNEGPLYIIEIKKTIPKRKFQLQLETNSLMNEKDEKVDIDEIIVLLENNESFIEWYDNLIMEFYKKKIVNNKLILVEWLPSRFTGIEFESLEKLTFFDKFDQPLNNSLDKLINLQELTFGDEFNKPLNNSLDKLINLQELNFGKNFDQPLGNSLDKLINLRKLTISSIVADLDKLTQLTELTFDDKFNQPLDISLDNLINLQKLTFGYRFDQPLNNSLDNLINLQKLTFDNNFNQLLDNSLDKLTNLQELNFDFNFDQPLYNSLDNLINLQKLKLGFSFNQPLGNSLDNLTNLQKLKLSNNFNQPLGNSLDKLINLQELYVGWDFNQPLGNSLDNLTNLQELDLGYSFNQPLGNSLDKLINLQKLDLGYTFNHPLGNSLDKLINLQKLKLSYWFDKPLGKYKELIDI